MKKIFTLLVALVATTALWAEDFEVDGIYYNILSNNEVEVTYRGSSSSSYDNEYMGSVTIPSTVTYNGTTYSVTSIGDQAFCYCYGLTSITIPNSVTSIGGWAFYYCYGLTSITIGNSVTSIGYYAFYMCTGLTSIEIPNSVASIGNYAFWYCSGLTSVTIPNSVTSIGEHAFYDCSFLTSITIPNSVTSIGESAFKGCSSLTTVVWNAKNCADFASYSESPFYDLRSQITSFTLGEDVKHIQAYLCYEMSKLTSITIPNSVTTIGNHAFEGCKGLTSIEFPNSVTSIGKSAFASCKGLTSIEIPNSVTSIGNHVFWGCSGLTSVTIPNSVTSIGYYAFEGCKGLKSITIPYSVTSIGNSAFYGCSSLTSITIPESVTSIGNSAFYGCSSLTSITIPKSVTSIGGYAFYGCSSLTSITIPNSVTSIEDWVFSRCTSLTSITIPNSVTSIGDEAFFNCSSLTSVTIPNSVTSIGDDSFSWCSSLTSITIPESVTSIGSSTFYNCSSLPVENNLRYAGTYLVEAVDKTLPTYSIKDGTKWIGSSAFSSCSSLTSITIPNSVTSIGSAFYNCSALKSITCEATIPPTAEAHAFYGVSTYIPVYVPCGSESAYKAADGYKEFINIQELQMEYSIQVYTSNSQMGSSKVNYNNCTGNQISATPNIGYHFVQWSDGNTDNPRTLELTQDTILTTEFAQSFSGQCGDNLYWTYNEDSKKISITGSGDMYDYTKATQPWLLFQDQITEVTTSNPTTSIGTSAFEGCIRLGKISLGTGLEEIAANAFAGCTRLYDIYTYATYPPFAEESSFANYNVDLYIPCESKRDYEYDIVWGKFKYIECIGAESDDTGGDDIVITPGSTDVTITWPTDPNAETYVIVIKQGDKVFCSLTFNADGMLLNIAFAPSRSGSHPVTYATSTGNGLRFTVTSLEESTTYGYDITTKDDEEKILSTYTGEFTTKSNVSTSVSDIQSPITNCQKLLRNGQLIILRDGKTYNAMGVEM